MSAPPGFAERVAGYSNVQLAKVISSSSEYTPEAIAIVMAEWDRRKLTADVVAGVAAREQEREEMHARPDLTRPQVWKGIGFICYGREFSSNVGYITTQWFCLFFIPLLPVQSFYVGSDDLGAGGIATKMAVHIRQAVWTYAFVVVTAAFLVAGSLIAEKLSEADRDYASFGVIAGSIIIPIFLLQLLRRNARRQKSNQAPERTAPKSNRRKNES